MRTPSRRTGDAVPPENPERAIALTSGDPEAAWLLRIRAGDVTAFEALYRAYAVPLYRAVLGYVGDRAVAEELVQDVLCRVWEHRERWQVRDSVRTYLFTAARNHALNHLRRERVVRQWTAKASAGVHGTGTSQDAESADARVESMELRHALARGIAALPARLREAYTLRYQQHLRVADVAAVMGISAKGAEMALARATKALRAALTKILGPLP